MAPAGWTGLFLRESRERLETTISWAGRLTALPETAMGREWPAS